MTETADQRINRNRLEGAELAAIALSDRPDDEAAIDNATDAGATWGKTSGMYYLAMPNSMDTIAVIDADGDISFGSSIDQYRNFQTGNPFDIAYDMAVELGIEEVADLDKAAGLLAMESQAVGRMHRVDMDRVPEVLADCL